MGVKTTSKQFLCVNEPVREQAGEYRVGKIYHCSVCINM